MCLLTFDWEQNDSRHKYEKFKSGKAPTWVVIELTRACNFNCIWCYADCGPDTEAKQMNWNEAKQFIKILADSGVKQVTCSGGEPTVYPHLHDFVKEAYDYGLITHMTTNGYLMDEKRTRELVKLGLTQVQINIDSLDAVEHDQVRGMNGSYDKALQALKNASNEGISAVSQTVITKNNENNILEILDYARNEVGVTRCRVGDLMPAPGKAMDTIDLKPTNFIETLKQIEQYAYETGATSFESGDPLFPQDYKTKLKVYSIGCCAAAGMLTHISQEGGVYFCATQRDPMYNIFEKASENGGSIEDVHKNEIDSFLDKKMVPIKCVNCGHYEQCKAGCPSRRECNDGVDYYCSHLW